MMRNGRLTLCVFIDAFGWEVSRRHAFLDDILEHKAPLRTIFGYSSTCDPTILTGAMPRDHGHFAFFTYNPKASPFRFYKFFGLLPKFLMERGRVRAKLSQIMKRVHGFTGYFQLYSMPFRLLHFFDYSERKNIFEPGGINGGQPTLFDYLRENEIPFCRPEGYNETESIVEVECAIEKGDVALAFLYFGRLDGLMHQYGPESPKATEHIAWYDEQLRRVYDKATKNYEEVDILLFSDHGMTQITETCDVMAQIDSLDLTFGEDYAAVFDSTMARFWFLKPGVRERVEGVLAAESCGHIMSEEELAGYGCDFPDNAYGELFYLMNPGVLICPSHMGVKPLEGMHGFSPDDKDSVASFMTNRALESMPEGLEDLYALMRGGIASGASDGKPVH